MKKLIFFLSITFSSGILLGQTEKKDNRGFQQIEEMQKEMWKMMEELTNGSGNGFFKIDTLFFKDLTPFGQGQTPEQSEQFFKEMNELFGQFFGNFEDQNNFFSMPFMEQFKEQMEKMKPLELTPEMEKERKEKLLRSRKKRKSYTL